MVYHQSAGPGEPLWIETSGSDAENGPSRAGITVEAPSAEGWRQIGKRFPGRGNDVRLEVGAFLSDSVRLVSAKVRSSGLLYRSSPR